jgi:hypothetical protein
MTSIIIWKLIAAIFATPSAAIVARAVMHRMSNSWKLRVSEIDYLRTEVKREREEAEAVLRAARAEHAAALAAQDQLVERLHRRIENVEGARDSLAADLKVAQHDVETARRFVDGATATRKDKK